MDPRILKNLFRKERVDGVLDRFVGVYEGKEEVLAASHYFDSSSFWGFDRSD